MGGWKIFKARKKAQSGIFVAIDIGTEVLKILFCEKSEAGVAVLGSLRQRQSISDIEAGYIRNIEAMSAKVKSLTEHGIEEFGLEPSFALAGISGELVRSLRITIQYLRPHAASPFQVNELKNLVNRLEWKARDSIRKQLIKELNQPDLDVKLVHASVSDIKIDGQNVANPVGFVGQEVVMTALVSFAPAAQLGALHSVMKSSGLELDQVFAQSFAVARSVGTESDYDGIIIDVGGGTTDISVVRRGNVEGGRSFSLGGRTFTSRIHESSGLSMSEAEALKLKYSAGELDEATAKQVQKVILPDAKVWLSGVKIALQEFNELDSLPSKIFLCGGASQLPEISRVLKTNWHEEMPFPQKPAIRFLKPKDLSAISDEGGLLIDAQDITPASLAAMAALGEVAAPSATKIVKNILSPVYG